MLSRAPMPVPAVEDSENNILLSATEESLSSQDSSQPATPLAQRGIAFSVRMFSMLTALAFLLMGAVCMSSIVLYIRQHFISEEDIYEIVQPRKQMPYYLKFITCLLSAVCNTMILGPPVVKHRHAAGTDCCSKIAFVGKQAYTLFLLVSFLAAWWADIQKIVDYAALQNLTISGMLEFSEWFPRFVRTFFIVVLQSFVSPNFNKLVDLLVLVNIVHESINFAAVHDRDLLNRWVGDEEVYNEGHYASEVIVPNRLGFVLTELVAINGPLFAFYAFLIGIRFLTQMWIMAASLAFICLIYPWLIGLSIVMCLILRVAVVAPLVQLLQSIRNCRASAGPAFETTDYIAVGPARHLKFDIERLQNSPEEKAQLRLMFKALSDSSSIPLHIDRKVPRFMYFNRFNAVGADDQRVADYQAELDTLSSTGLLRDGWVYVVVWSTALRILPELLCTIGWRYIAGDGYLEAITATLSERHFSSWIMQYQTRGSMVLDTIMKAL